MDTSKQKSLVKQSQFVHRQNPTPGVTNVVGEVFSLTLLGMAPPDMWLLLAVAVLQMVGFLKAEVVFESLQVEPEMVLELIQVEDKVVLELLQLTGKVVVVKPVNFLNNLILLLTEHMDMLVAPLVLVVVVALLVLVELSMVVVLLMLPAEPGLSPNASPIF